MAGTKDLIIEQGTTFDITFTWSTKDGLGVKTPVDLTNYSAKSQIRESYDSTTAVATMSTTDSSIVLGGSAGTIRMKLTNTQTSAITITSGVWDLELTDTVSGNVTRLLEGKVTVKPEVTK